MAAMTDTDSSTSDGEDLDTLPPIEDVDGEGRQAGEQLSSLPPLVLISSMVKRFMSLVKLANPGVAVIHYNYQSTTLNRILHYIKDRLRGRKAYSICFVAHGRPGNFKLISQKNVTLASVREDRELREFFTEVVSKYLHNESELARIDILNCPVEDDAEGKQMVQTLSKLVGVPIHTAKDIWGAELSFSSGNGDASPIKIGTLYFDGQRLKEWCNADSEMKLDKYEKIRLVGQGAYGQAVLYRRKDDDSKVILKKINVLELKKEERQGVLTEIKILAMLDHPHIVSYYDSFEENGVMMIEMEYAEGGSLQQHLKNQNCQLTELDVLTKFSQMVDAIRYIHVHNILHRDLKTANIFLTRFGSVKLGDFGIAKVLSATQEAAQTMVGTPYYISPEICTGKPYDAKSDIWSLGCILYEMMCLQKTFEGTNLPALVHKIVEGSFEPIKGQYGEGLKQLARKMLQKNPKDRPSADQLHIKLVPILLKPLQEKEGVLPLPLDIAPPDDVNTKSFLYHLDGSSFLLKPVAHSIQERIHNVAVGYSHIVAVTDELNVYSWGHNSHGQLGQGDQLTRNNPVLVESLNGRNIKNAQCGGEFSIFMNENGIIMSCGRGDRGMLGHGNTRDCFKPEMIQELLSHDVSTIQCGESHVVMLSLDGRIFVWGSGDCGRLGTGSGDDCLKPTEITVRSPGTRMDETVRDVRCGVDCSVFVTDVGRIFACGNNADNKLGLNRRETFLMHMKKLLSKNQLEVPCCSIPTPIKELGKHRIVDCFMGVTHSVFLTESGLVYTFGRNLEAQLGTGHALATEMPNIVKGFDQKPLIVKSMELATIVASEGNTFYLWGSRPVVIPPLKTVFSGQPRATDDGGPPIQTPSSPDSGYKESSPPQTLKRHTFEDLAGNESNSSSHTPSAIPKIKKFTEQIVKESETHESPKIKRKSIIEVMFTEVPHEQVTCTVATEYVSTVYETSNQLLNNSVSKGGNKITRQTSTASSYNVKKGSHGSVDRVNMSSNGKIMSPVSIDLVEESGISSSLWAQGLEDIKLEDIVCYGSNLVVLIYATLPKKGAAPVNRRKESFVVGTKLRRSLMSSSSLASFHLPAITDGKPFTHPETLKEESEGEIRKATFTIERPMSPTTELPTWLKGDLQDGIPFSSSSPPPEPKDKIEESHGWFPNSMKMSAAVSPTAVNGPTEGQKGNKRNMLTRRPSGLEIGVTSSDPSLPPVAIPDQVTAAGIKRLPTAAKMIRQDSIAEAPAQYKTSVKLPEASSLANLPTKSTVRQQSTVKRVRSSTNVSKPVIKSVQTKPTDRPKLQKSYTTPSRFEEPDESRNHKKNSNSSLASNQNEAASKKVKLPNVSPYMQPIVVKSKSSAAKPSKLSVSQSGNKNDARRKSQEELQKKFEEEKTELKKIYEEKEKHAEENNQQLRARIEDLNRRLQMMEENRQSEFDQFKEKLSQIEKDNAKAHETITSQRNSTRSRFCMLM